VTIVEDDELAYGRGCIVTALIAAQASVRDAMAHGRSTQQLREAARLIHEEWNAVMEEQARAEEDKHGE
jgi:hypothetical protein